MPSSIIKSFTYNQPERKLRVVLVNGTTYDYLEVPEDVYTKMKNAFAKGTFFNNEIKPFYKYEKISDSGSLKLF
jgi:hypothetical protein